MNIWKQIKVSFFLGVMGIMMLHNALPHLHHSHETDGAVSTKRKHHHQTHDQTHHHSHKQIYHQSVDDLADHSSQTADHPSQEQSMDHSRQFINHHSDEQEEEDDTHGFLLGFLLNNHSHSFHTHEFLRLAKAGNQYVLDKHQPERVVLDSYRSFPEYENPYLHRFSLFRPAYYDDPLSLNSPLRGPPSLG